MEDSWLGTYGLWAVFFGAMIEGEAIFIAAGYAVSQGYLPPLPTLSLMIVGATLGDHLYFLVGRTWGARLLRKFPSMRPLRARATLLIRRWGRATAFAGRFAYGVRSVVSLTLGASRFPLLTFSIFDGLACVAFACIYLSLGFFFGEAVEDFIGRAGGAELQILVGIVVAGALVWAIWEWKLFHSPADVEDEEEDDDERR